MLVDKFFLCDVCSNVIRLHPLKRHILERQITLFIVTCNIIRYLLKVEHKPKTKDYLDSIMTQGFSPK